MGLSVGIFIASYFLSSGHCAGSAPRANGQMTNAAASITANTITEMKGFIVASCLLQFPRVVEEFLGMNLLPNADPNLARFSSSAPGIASPISRRGGSLRNSRSSVGLAGAKARAAILGCGAPGDFMIHVPAQVLRERPRLAQLLKVAQG